MMPPSHTTHPHFPSHSPPPPGQCQSPLLHAWETSRAQDSIHRRWGRGRRRDANEILKPHMLCPWPPLCPPPQATFPRQLVHPVLLLLWGHWHSACKHL